MRWGYELVNPFQGLNYKTPHFIADSFAVVVTPRYRTQQLPGAGEREEGAGKGGS